MTSTVTPTPKPRRSRRRTIGISAIVILLALAVAAVALAIVQPWRGNDTDGSKPAVIAAKLIGLDVLATGPDLPGLKAEESVAASDFAHRPIIESLSDPVWITAASPVPDGGKMTFSLPHRPTPAGGQVVVAYSAGPYSSDQWKIVTDVRPVVDSPADKPRLEFDTDRLGVFHPLWINTQAGVDQFGRLLATSLPPGNLNTREPQCEQSQLTRDTVLEVQQFAASGLKLCTGVLDGVDVVRVVNSYSAPLKLKLTGLTVLDERKALGGGMSRYFTGSDTDAEFYLAPGVEVLLRYDSLSNGGTAKIESSYDDQAFRLHVLNQLIATTQETAKYFGFVPHGVNDEWLLNESLARPACMDEVDNATEDVLITRIIDACLNVDILGTQYTHVAPVMAYVVDMFATDNTRTGNLLALARKDARLANGTITLKSAPVTPRTPFVGTWSIPGEWVSIPSSGDDLNYRRELTSAQCGTSNGEPCEISATLRIIEEGSVLKAKVVGLVYEKVRTNYMIQSPVQPASGVIEKDDVLVLTIENGSLVMTGTSRGTRSVLECTGSC